MITKGAHADMIPVEGDPTGDLGSVAGSDAKFRGIVKAGAPHKNTLRRDAGWLIEGRAALIA